ncbi:MAG: uroporphyrinogen decarboxylase family protein [Anaerolineae bacterium]
MRTAGLSSRQRVITALEGGIPDRVPVGEMIIDPRVIESISPGMDYADFVDYADIDMVTCLTMADSPEDIAWLDREKRVWRDKWGACQQLTHDVISMVVPPAVIETEDDLAAYVPPDPAKATVHGYARKLVDRFKGKRAIAVVGEAVLAPSLYMRAGLENLMTDYALRPELMKKIAGIGVDYHIELYRRLLSEGVEVIIIGDDYAGKTGTFMSPTHFAEYILPGLTTIVGEVKRAGGYVIHHTDGDIWKIIEMLLSTGLDMLGPLEPACMRLDEVRRYGGGRVGVMGNVDVDLLARGTTNEVKAATRELLQRLAGLGGHILSSGNTISSYVRGENYLAMLEAARDFGR